MSWSPTSLLTQQQIDWAKKASVVDPAVFQAPEAEQRAFLQEHKDLLTLSFQERASIRYTMWKSIFLARPYVVRVILVILAILLVAVLVPITLWCLYKVARNRTIEVVSIIILLIITWWVWRAFVRDL